MNFLTHRWKDAKTFKKAGWKPNSCNRQPCDQKQMWRHKSKNSPPKHRVNTTEKTFLFLDEVRSKFEFGALDVRARWSVRSTQETRRDCKCSHHAVRAQNKYLISTGIDADRQLLGYLRLFDSSWLIRTLVEGRLKIRICCASTYFISLVGQ